MPCRDAAQGPQPRGAARDGSLVRFVELTEPVFDELRQLERRGKPALSCSRSRATHHAVAQPLQAAMTDHAHVALRQTQSAATVAKAGCSS